MKINYLLIFLLLALFYLISPFFATIFSSLLLTYITLPLFKGIDNIINHKRISALITTFLSIISFSLIYYSFFKLIQFIINRLNLFFLNINFSSFIPLNKSFIINPITYQQSIFLNPSKQLLETVLMIFLIFYFLYESQTFFESLNKRIKKQEIKKFLKFKENFDSILKSIFLKYFTKAIFLGLIIYISLSFLNIPYSFEVSVFGAVSSIIPLFNVGILIFLVSIYYLLLGNKLIFLVLLIESLFFTLMHYNFNIIFKIRKEINPLIFVSGAIVGVFSLGVFGFIAGPVLAGALQAFYETISEQ
ncbi:MAG: AI-2E family transporter [Candidatus Nanoarchaeia archaeon]|jgi:predicted PurR-regulated permease PerM